MNDPDASPAILSTDTVPEFQRPGVSHPKIVCLGSSAGGLEALIEFFKHMTADSGLAFVVIQHLKADIPSLTPIILSGTTQMMVTVAKKSELVLANHVYVIPPNAQMTISGGRIYLAPRVEAGARHHPFDFFLNSLAKDSRERAIAVVLSGYDGDGSEGFIAIKAQGGITYAQDQSALIDQMPEHAMATGCVDFVLNPGQIADSIAQRR